MVKLHYVVTRKGKEIPSAIYRTWEEAKTAVAALNNPNYSFKPLYVHFNPEESEKTLADFKDHVKKVNEKLTVK